MDLSRLDTLNWVITSLTLSTCSTPQASHEWIQGAAWNQTVSHSFQLYHYNVEQTALYRSLPKTCSGLWCWYNFQRHLILGKTPEKRLFSNKTSLSEAFLIPTKCLWSGVQLGKISSTIQSKSLFNHQDGNVRAAGAEVSSEGISEEAEEGGWIKADWYLFPLLRRET